MEQTNKALSRRVLEEVWSKGNLAAVDELFAPDAVFHVPPPPPGAAPPPAGTGPLDRLKLVVNRARTAFPDLRFTIEDQIAEGDKVVTRWTLRGTQKGELTNTPFGTIPPTGKEVSITGITIHRFVNGKIAEIWGNIDILGSYQQLGLIPPAPPAWARS